MATNDIGISNDCDVMFSEEPNNLMALITAIPVEQHGGEDEDALELQFMSCNASDQNRHVYRTIKTMNAILQRKFDVFQERFTSQEKEIKFLTKKSSKQESEITELKNEHEEYRKEIELMSEKVQKLENELSKANEEIARLEKELKATKDENTEKDKKYQELEAMYNAVNMDKIALEEKVKKKHKYIAICKQIKQTCCTYLCCCCPCLQGKPSSNDEDN